MILPVGEAANYKEGLLTLINTVIPLLWSKELLIHNMVVYAYDFFVNGLVNVVAVFD